MEKIQGKSYRLLLVAMAHALSGRVVCYSTPKGNLIILNEKEFEKLKEK